MNLFSLVLGCGAALTPGQPEIPPPVGAPWPVEVAPPPRVSLPPVAVMAVPGGYQVRLNRRTAELVRDALEQADEKQIASTLRDRAKDMKTGAKPDPDTAATLELIAFVTANQLPGFKKAMRENQGPNGVVITINGLQAPAVTFRKPRPRLERAVAVVRGTMPLMPDEARGAVEALRAVARTTPLVWRVEPQ